MHHAHIILYYIVFFLASQSQGRFRGMQRLSICLLCGVIGIPKPMQHCQGEGDCSIECCALGAHISSCHRLALLLLPACPQPTSPGTSWRSWRPPPPTTVQQQTKTIGTPRERIKPGAQYMPGLLLCCSAALLLCCCSCCCCCCCQMSAEDVASAMMR